LKEAYSGKQKPEIYAAGEFLPSIVRFWNSGDSTDYFATMGGKCSVLVYRGH